MLYFLVWQIVMIYQIRMEIWIILKTALVLLLNVKMTLKLKLYTYDISMNCLTFYNLEDNGYQVLWTDAWLFCFVITLFSRNQPDVN